MESLIGPSFIRMPNSVDTSPSGFCYEAVLTILEACVRAAMIDFVAWQFKGTLNLNLSSKTGITIQRVGESGFTLGLMLRPESLVDAFPKRPALLSFVPSSYPSKEAD